MSGSLSVQSGKAELAIGKAWNNLGPCTGDGKGGENNREGMFYTGAVALSSLPWRVQAKFELIGKKSFVTLVLFRAVAGRGKSSNFWKRLVASRRSDSVQ